MGYVYNYSYSLHEIQTEANRSSEHFHDPMELWPVLQRHSLRDSHTSVSTNRCIVPYKHGILAVFHRNYTTANDSILLTVKEK